MDPVLLTMLSASAHNYSYFRSTKDNNVVAHYYRPLILSKCTVQSSPLPYAHVIVRGACRSPVTRGSSESAAVPRRGSRSRFPQRLSSKRVQRSVIVPRITCNFARRVRTLVRARSSRSLQLAGRVKALLSPRGRPLLARGTCPPRPRPRARRARCPNVCPPCPRCVW